MSRLFLPLHTLIGPSLAGVFVLVALTFGMAGASPVALILLALASAGLPVALYASRGGRDGAAGRLTDPASWLTDRVSGL